MTYRKSAQHIERRKPGMRLNRRMYEAAVIDRMTLAAAGDLLGISPERARQRLMKYVRQSMGSAYQDLIDHIDSEGGSVLKYLRETEITESIGTRVKTYMDGPDPAFLRLAE